MGLVAYLTTFSVAVAVAAGLDKEEADLAGEAREGGSLHQICILRVRKWRNYRRQSFPRKGQPTFGW